MKEIRSGRHCVFMLHCHLLFVTKYRGKVLDEAMLAYMEEVMRHVCSLSEVDMKEFNGEADHVHLLINYPPKVQLSKLVNSLKGVSSRRIRKEFPSSRVHGSAKSGSLWSPSYFAGSVGGAPWEVLRQYIEQQSRPL